MLINRREFVLAGFSTLVGWVVGAPVLERIVQCARENRQPYLVDVENAHHTLFANWNGSEYLFTLDERYADIQPPELTWRDWLELRYIDPTDRAEVRAYCREQGLENPKTGRPWRNLPLDAPVPDPLLQEYVENEFARRESPVARAYQLLDDIPLATEPPQGEPLGALQFVDGCCPGNDALYVSTREVETLGGLQQRLLQLGYRVDLKLA